MIIFINQWSISFKNRRYLHNKSGPVYRRPDYHAELNLSTVTPNSFSSFLQESTSYFLNCFSYSSLGYLNSLYTPVVK